MSDSINHPEHEDELPRDVISTVEYGNITRALAADGFYVVELGSPYLSKKTVFEVRKITAKCIENDTVGWFIYDELEYRGFVPNQSYHPGADVCAAEKIILCEVE